MINWSDGAVPPQESEDPTFKPPVTKGTEDDINESEPQEESITDLESKIAQEQREETRHQLFEQDGNKEAPYKVNLHQHPQSADGLDSRK